MLESRASGRRPARVLARLPRRARSESGAAAVEFGLVAMLLLLIMLAIIQYSVYFWSFQVAEHASREGARAYAVNPCASQTALITNRVGAASAGGLAISRSFSAANPPEAGDQVTVRVAFNVHRLDGGLLPGPAQVRQVATARVEDVEDC
ncbi:MAG: TadE/TadG family type IV pilus assembly protein [Nocardioides sp.]